MTSSPAYSLLAMFVFLVGCVNEPASPSDMSPTDSGADPGVDAGRVDAGVVPPERDGGTDCVPSCGASVCGPDGCGGRCGDCASDEACMGGACVELNMDGCPPPGPYGTQVGDTATNVTLHDCDGNEVSLHDLCSRQVSVVYGFAEWCPGCRDTLRNHLPNGQGDLGIGQSELVAMGDLQTFVVVTENSSRTLLGQEDCQRVRDEFELDSQPGVRVLYDAAGLLAPLYWDGRTNETAIVMTRHNEIYWNRASIWNTIVRRVTEAFEAP